MCTHIRPNSDIGERGIKEGDIITKIQDYDVQYDGTIRPPFWKNPLPYKSIIYRGAIEDQLKIQYYSVKARALLETQAKLEHNTNVFREMWPEFENIRYCTFGGVVVQPLVANLVNPKVDKHFHWKFHNMMKSPLMKHKSVVVITHLQANCPFKKTPGTLAVGDVIIGVNDIPLHGDTDVDPFDRYVNAWKALGGADIITLRTRDGNISSITRKDLLTGANATEN